MGPYDHADEWTQKHNRYWSEDALKELESLVEYERNRRNVNREKLRQLIDNPHDFYVIHGEFIKAEASVEMWVDNQYKDITLELIESDAGAHPVLACWVTECSKLLLDIDDVDWIKDNMIRLVDEYQDDYFEHAAYPNKEE